MKLKYFTLRGPVPGQPPHFFFGNLIQSGLLFGSKPISDVYISYKERFGDIYLFWVGFTRYTIVHNIDDVQYIFNNRNKYDQGSIFLEKYELYREFSNFYPAPIQLDGYTWPTVEHYFQAQKFVSNEMHFKNILGLATPREAFDYVRTYKSLRRSDWENVKDDLMFKACLAKFQQHPELKELLLSTGDRTLIEHTKNDSYWGDGGDGTGRNQLGITLMKVRDYLNNHH
ncbi:unnamed protein product [Adineta steineri]|uniref:NADAR domain-containing protein n=1 Tax=Adineta steineri TaxID=433720 RepID=A0A814TBT5_9BILA|nr:unnamed protein product [Adineta steineri]CAF1349526.1 unnamed protein product [Adineta steineri]